MQGNRWTLDWRNWRPSNNYNRPWGLLEKHAVRTTFRNFWFEGNSNGSLSSDCKRNNRKVLRRLKACSRHWERSQMGCQASFDNTRNLLNFQTICPLLCWWFGSWNNAEFFRWIFATNYVQHLWQHVESIRYFNPRTQKAWLFVHIESHKYLSVFIRNDNVRHSLQNPR